MEQIREFRLMRIHVEEIVNPIEHRLETSDRTKTERFRRFLRFHEQIERTTVMIDWRITKAFQTVLKCTNVLHIFGPLSHIAIIFAIKKIKAIERYYSNLGSVIQTQIIVKWKCLPEIL